MAHRLRRSAVWANFKKISDSLVVCLICHKNFRFYGNTSNMKGHLKRRHCSNGDPSLNVQFVQHPTTTTNGVPIKEPSSPPACSSQTSPKLIQMSQLSSQNDDVVNEDFQKFNTALVEMIVKDVHSTHITEGVGFINFVKALQPSYSLPSVRKLSTELLPIIYNQIYAKVECLVNSAAYLALSIEIWSNVNNECFLTVVSHYLANVTRKTSHLETIKIVENYTSEDLAFSFSTILDKWNLTEKIVTIISKYNLQVKGAVELHLEKSYLPCVAHTFGNSIDCAINANETLNTVLEKCRNLLNHFSCNSSMDNLKGIQKQIELSDLKIQQEYSHRWNSQFKMLSTFLDIKETLNSIMPSLPIPIDNFDWHIIEDCAPLLEPFQEVAAELHREEFPGISLTIPLVKGLQYSLKKQEPKTETGIILKDHLIKIIANDLVVLETNSTFAKATLLDPRFKKVAFSVEKNAEMAQIWVMEELGPLFAKKHSEAKKNFSEGETSSSISLLWEQFDLEVTAMNVNPTANDDIFSLVKQYLDLPLVHRSRDPLLFWDAYKHSFPELYELSLKYLCIPATSVSSGRFFTKDGKLVIEKRRLLTGESIQQIIFLNSNFDC